MSFKPEVIEQIERSGWRELSAEEFAEFASRDSEILFDPARLGSGKHLQ